jgi:putative transposase
VLFSCKYHVVFCPKYRRPVLMPPIDLRLKELTEHVCDETQFCLIEMEVMPDHVHLLLDCDPQFGMHRLVRGIKGRTSHVLRQEFQVLRSVCRCKIRNFSEMRRSGSDSSWDRPETERA